jgi:hypothetical protein
MTTSQTLSLLDAALAYAAQGWHVFPCHTPTAHGCSCTKRAACKDISKHPRTKNGLSDATTDEGQIRRWWTMWPEANVAICTGAVSGLVVLDRDDYKGGADSIEELERTYSPLPETVLSITGGGGQHYVFAHPGSHVKNKVETLGPGLDIRGDGGYIIAPPSLHTSGKRYVWEVEHEPDDTPLAPLPDWVRVLCQETARQERRDAGAPIPDHQRNATLFSHGCSFRARGCTEAVILAALREMNATQCQPPLTDAEVQKIVGSIAKYEAGPSREDLYQHRNGDTPGAGPTGTGKPLVIDMDTVRARAIEWLWYPYIAIGKLCILDGDPGVGKTLFATQLAAGVSRGHPMPDQDGKPTLSPGEPGVVIFIATEDDLEDTVKPRLEQAGADCTKVKAFNEWQDGAGHIHTFTLADLPHLETVLQTYRPRLVYIDAIQAVLGGKVDANRANQLKELLDPLAKLAATYRCAILASRHPAKPGQNNVKLIHRGANSMAILGTARLGLYAEDHPTDKTKVLLLQSKSNAGAIGRTQIFSKAEGRFEWAGMSRITKEDLAGPAHGPDSRGWLEAYFWLEHRLEGGLAWPATDLETEADLQDLSPKSLKRAKKALGVVSTQLKGEAGPGWTWRLPPLTTSPCPTPSTGATEPTGATGATGSPDLKSKTYEESKDSAAGGEEARDPEGSEVPEAPVDPGDPVDRVVTDVGVDARVSSCGDGNLSPLVSTPDCLPPPCAHPETRTETMLDGSTLIRCLTCRYLHVTPAERKME